MIDANELTISTLVLECLPRTRAIGESAFWQKYERLCAKHRVVALPGQVKTALRRLKQEGKIIISANGARRL